jgi:hypothetical protein
MDDPSSVFSKDLILSQLIFWMLVGTIVCSACPVEVVSNKAMTANAPFFIKDIKISMVKLVQIVLECFLLAVPIPGNRNLAQVYRRKYSVPGCS